MAYAAAFRICGDRVEAQDILQQALIVLARRSPELGQVKCLGAWLHRVVVLEARKARRKAVNRRLRETMAHQENEVSEEQEGLARQIAPELDQSLDTMNEKDRWVLTLHYLEGLTFETISRRLGGTSEAWQKRSVRALGKLARKLRARGISVSGVAMGAYLLTSRAEAGVAASVLHTLTCRALEQGARDTAAAGKLAVLLTMKTGVAISLGSGVLLAYGWGALTHDPLRLPPHVGSRTGEATESDPEYALAARRERGFTLEMVKEAMNDYDRTETPDPRLESRLRSLMFLVPEEALEDVFKILMASRDHQRFQQIAAALFACWAERDPAAALARSQEAADFSYQARRAVMITWLNQDIETAVVMMLANKSDEDKGFLSEYVTYQCERTPAEAAALVDRIAKDWPEADRMLFERVARLWCRSDALSAGDWVASYPDEQVSRPLLRSMAMDVAKIRGFEGLAIANHIGDARARLEARNNAIYWWAITTAGSSIIPGQASPVRDVSGGFPADWTAENIRTFAQAAMVNYADKFPEILKIARDEDQRILIYEGAIKGAAWSNPAAVTEAAEHLPDSFAQSSGGKKTLGAFVRRWNEMDPVALADWLSTQPPGPKTVVMRDALNKEGTKR